MNAKKHSYLHFFKPTYDLSLEKGTFLDNLLPPQNLKVAIYKDLVILRR
jgi:hypothetical protein